MRRCGLAIALIAASVLVGCPRAPAAPPVNPAEGSAKSDMAALVIPPTPASHSALVRVTKRARAGDVVAAWARAHYLFDLFDDARFAAATDSLSLLATSIRIAVTDLRGVAGTDRAIAALQLEVDRVADAARLHPGAQAMRTLLHADATPPTRRSQVLQRMTELKAVARGASVVATNARFRLLDYCLRALEDATRARWSERMRHASHCLYPLYDADPAPYFSRDPRKRPPAPEMSVVLTQLRKQVGVARASSARLGRAGRLLSKRMSRIARAAPGAVTAPPDPARLTLPRAKTAIPYDWTPRLRFGHGLDLPKQAEEIARLEKPLQGDGRGAVSLVLSVRGTGRAVRHAAAIAQQAGATSLRLVVGLEQQLVVPQGDYWSGKTNGTVLRAGVLSLALLSSQTPTSGRVAHGGTDWDPTRATLGLTLHLDVKQWTLTGAEGKVATGAITDIRALRLGLARVRAAYDYEQGLTVVPEPGTPYRYIVAAIDGAAQPMGGRALFSRFALKPVVPSYANKGLATRIKRRESARVTIEPAAMRRQTTLVRRCYQDRLELRPKLATTLRVEGKNGVVVVRSGTRDVGLRACVRRALRDVMRGAATTTATITLAPR